MPAGRVIGRVSVKVLPDTDDFKQKAKTQLETIERQLQVKIPTSIDMSGASRELLAEIRKMNQRNRMLDSRKITLYTRLDTSGNYMKGEITKALRSLDDQIRTGKRRPTIRLDVVAGTLKADLDKQSLKDVEDKLKNWRDRISPLSVLIKPELMVGSTTWAEKRLDYLTRPRGVPIVPYLQSTAVAKVTTGIATMIAAASGGRVVSEMFESIWNAAKNLDKSVPLIGTIAEAILGLGAVGITSVSNLAALSYTLAQIGAVAFTLPATFASAAIGIGVLIAALKDFNTVLPEIKGILSDLQDSISAKFWAKAKEPIRSFVKGLLPEFSSGFGRVATALGSFTADFVTTWQRLLKLNVGDMFDGFLKGLDNARGAAAPLANILTTLGLVGANYLPKIGTWITDIATRFDDWLSKVASNGQLQQWVDTGLQALSDLGRVLSNIGGIFAGIGRAAEAGGGSTLGMFADTLERIHAVIDTPAFQSGLTAVFVGAHQAMAAIANNAGPALTNFFEAFGQTLAAVLPLVGHTIGNLLGGIADALAQPAVQQGLMDFLAGINTAVNGLLPALQPIGALLGQLGTTLGAFLSVVGPAVGTLLSTLAPIFTDLLAALTPIITMLGGGLGRIFQILAPAITLIGDAFVGLVEQMQPIVAMVIEALMPALAALAPVIGTVLSQAINSLAPILPMIGSLLAALIPLFGQLIAAVLPLLPPLIQLVVAVLTPLIPVVLQIVSAVLPPLIAAIQALVQAVIPVLAIIGQLVGFLIELLAPALTWVAELIGGMVVSVVNGLTSMFTGIQQIFQGFITMFTGGWSGLWDGIKMIGEGIWNLIVGAFNVLMNIGIFKIASTGFALLKGLFTGAWAAIKGGVNFAWAGIKALVSGGIGAIKGFISGGLNFIKGLFSSAWNKVKFDLGLAWFAIKEAVSSGIGKVVGFVKELPGKAASALSGIGGTLKDAGVRLIKGFLDGIGSMFETVKGKLKQLTDLLPDWKGPAKRDSTILVNAGQLVIEGFIVGLESRYDAVRQSLAGLTDDVANTRFVAPIPSVAGTLSAFDAAMADGHESFGGSGTNVEINIPTQTDADPEEIADAVLFGIKRIAAGGVYATRR